MTATAIEPELLAATRCLIALVLAIAAITKVYDQAGTQRAVADLGVGPPWSRPIATVLPVVELMIAGLLLVTATAPAGAAAAALLLGLFTSAIARTLRTGARPECHCFGQASAAPIGAVTIVRNLVLIAAAASVAVRGAGASLAASSAPGWVTSALAAALILAVLVIVVSHRTPTHRGAALDGARSRPSKMPVPAAPAPDLLVTARNGETAPLSALTAPGTPTIVLVTSSSCAPCRSIAPKLEAWSDSLAHHLAIHLLHVGPPDDLPTQPTGRHWAIDPQHLPLLGVRATPTALVLGADGEPTGVAAEGAAAIESLVRQTLAASMREAHRT